MITVLISDIIEIFSLVTEFFGRSGVLSVSIFLPEERGQKGFPLQSLTQGSIGQTSALNTEAGFLAVHHFSLHYLSPIHLSPGISGPKKKPVHFHVRACNIWHRPTLPPVTAVPLALAGLTSLFGMGRGGHRRYRHLNVLRLFSCKL